MVPPIRHRDHRDRLQPDGHDRGRDIGQDDGQPVVLVRLGLVHLQRHRGGEQRGTTGCQRLHPRCRRRHEYDPPLGRHGDPDVVHRSFGPGHPGADARVARGAHGGHRHRDRAGRQRRQRGVARLVGREQLLGHDECHLQRPVAGVPAARVGAEHDRWLPGLGLLVPHGGVGGDAGVLRHRPQRDLPPLTGRDRRRARRLQRGGPDGGVGHASRHLHRGHLAGLLRQRPDARPGHGQLHEWDDSSGRYRHPQQL